MSAVGNMAAAVGPDRDAVNAALEGVMGAVANGAVGDAMRYAVLGKGQRIRPVLALRIARMTGSRVGLAMTAALSVELLHAASLIVDDLPCMDDEAFRRGQPAVHRKFGEATAILAAFGLVALAARLPVESAASSRRCKDVLAYQRSLLCTLDCSELLGGQALDLGLDPSSAAAHPAAVTELKTAPLFELAARAGLLFSRACDTDRSSLERFGREFGVAFQMVDDVLDGDAALQPAKDRLQRVRSLLTPFGERAQELLALVDYLDVRLESGCGRENTDERSGLHTRAA